MELEELRRLLHILKVKCIDTEPVKNTEVEFIILNNIKVKIVVAVKLVGSWFVGSEHWVYIETSLNDKPIIYKKKCNDINDCLIYLCDYVEKLIYE